MHPQPQLTRLKQSHGALADQRHKILSALTLNYDSMNDQTLSHSDSSQLEFKIHTNYKLSHE